MPKSDESARQELIKRYPRYPWVEVAVEAKNRGQSPDSFRRWLHRVDESEGGGILKTFNPDGTKIRKLFLNVKKLDSLAGPDASERDAAISELRGEMAEFKIELKSVREFRRKANVMLRKLSKAVAVGI